ncbi:MAG: pectin acetylesterase-family hydrolase [Pseudomonadales bacterium]
MHVRLIGILSITFTGSLVVAGCTPAAEESAAASSEPAAATGTLVADSTRSTESGSGDWQVIEPGADTVCSDGSAYRFFVRAADPAKLLVYFQGGGACWFPENCDTHLQPSYKVNVADDDPSRYDGIFALTNPDNPFLEYSMVIAPYCTADTHMGDRQTSYQAPATEDHTAHELTIHHRGFVNSNAVLDWIYGAYSNPAEIFVTGSSAGSIPSPYFAWQIAAQYPGARIAQLGDASGGYRRSATTNTDRMLQWGTLDYLASRHPEFSEVTEDAFNYELLYIKAAQARPDILFAEYDAAEDTVQKRFLALGGSTADSLLDLLRANHRDIRAEVSNFRTYVGPGDSHTILGRPEFYTAESDGVRIRDWVADLAAYRTVQNVECDPCVLPAAAGKAD